MTHNKFIAIYLTSRLSHIQYNTSHTKEPFQTHKTNDPIPKNGREEKKRKKKKRKIEEEPK